MSNSRFSRFGAMCAGVTAVVVAIQMVLLRYLPDSAAPVKQLTLTNSSMWITLQWLPIGGVVLSLVALLAISLKADRRSPGHARLAFAFALLWAAFELAFRCTGFVLTRNLGNSFVQSTDPAQRTMLLERFAFWTELTNGFFLAIVVTGLIYAISYGLLLWSPNALDRITALAFFCYAILLFGSFLGLVGGISAGSEFFDSAYPFVRTLDRVAWAAWLWFARAEG